MIKFLISFILLTLSASGFTADKNQCPEITNPKSGKHSLERIITKQHGIYGIDVSHHQGQIDWQQVKTTGITFAYIKATEGQDWVDRCFERNWQLMPQAGVVRGAYHFFRGHIDPIAQARLFVNTIKPMLSIFDLPPVLDLEETVETKYLSPNVYAARAKTWLLFVERALGVKPIIYTNPHFWRTYLGTRPEFRGYPLWLGTTQRAPTAPTTWYDWTFWQFSHEGKIESILTPVDLNVFGGNSYKFAKLIRKH